MTKRYTAKLSDFGWAVSWEGEAEVDFARRQAGRFSAGLPFHRTPEEALSAWERRYGVGTAADNVV